MEKSVPNIVIFASGSGSNAENIIKWAQNHKTYRVAAVLCNRKDAFVLTRYKGESRKLTDVLHELGTDFIILAGFLLKVPEYLIAEWPERILNIHPALLPSFGGKGMYGDHVHQAVIAAGEKESGITIHIVDNQYDHGKTIYQVRCTVTPEDTPETLFAKVHELERAYPEVIEGYISQL